MVHTFNYSQSFDHESGFNFATRFSHDGNLIFSGGAGKNDLKVFMNNADSTANFKLQMEIKDLAAPVFAMDKAPGEK